jgi:hypothetical protein
MSCRERQTALQRCALGEADRDQARELERHLGSCPDCARDLARYRTLFAGLRALPEAEPPATLHADVVAALACERWAWRRDREPAWRTRLRRSFVGVMLAGATASLAVALWSWMDRIVAFAALRFSRDLVSLRDGAVDVWYLITLLGRALQRLRPAVEGAWDLLQRIGQPLESWGPVILATYGAALLLGGALFWRGLRQADERGVRHASHVSIS